MRDWSAGDRRIGFAALAAAAVLSCGEDAVAPPLPTTVTVIPAAVELASLEATVQLRAEIRDQHGQLMDVSWAVWSSGDWGVAGVDSEGLVTAGGNGTTVVTASVGQVSGSASVTVAQKVRSVSVIPATDTLTALGDTVRLGAEARDANGHLVEGAEFEWTSGDASVATVDPTGLATAVTNGTAVVAATAGEVSARAEVTVAQKVTSVSVSPAADTLTAVGDTVRLGAKALDANGHIVEGAEFGWATGNASVATVDATGLATAVANGTASLTATASEVAGRAAVTVAQKASSVSVSPAAAALPVGDTVRLTAEAFDANGHAAAGATFVWTSADRRVAVVDSAGLVTAVAKGRVAVTATSSGAAGRAALTVEAARPAFVEVTPDTVQMTALGQTAQLAVEVRDHGGTVMAATVTWSSGDTSVAKVDSAGLATAVGTGAAVVTATAGGVSDEAAVVVRQAVRSVVVSPGEASVGVGDTLRLAAEVLDDNGHPVAGAALAWSSSDASVATVNWSGLVRGVSAGAATITAVSGETRGSAEITVDNPDRAALVAFYQATDGPNWVNSRNWLTDAPLGEWYGVGTDRWGRVVSLSLGGRWDDEVRKYVPHGLSGPIPPELGELASLQWLYLAHNDLVGPIPPDLGRLTRLRSLHLGANGLTGSIPPELGNLGSLERLFLRRNDLTGSIPPELGRLANLDHLVLYANDLTGSIPPELGNLGSLEQLFVEGNDLTGSIPSELGRLGSLKEMYLGSNDLTGSIPPELGSLAKLEDMRLEGNDLTGSIPPELGQLANLDHLSLYANDLTGSIPPELGSMASLRWLALNDNDLTGAIPPELGRLAKLEVMYLSSNDLTGRIPPELGSLVSLEWLHLYFNERLTGPVPRAFLKLRRLKSFSTTGSTLCVPGTTEFVEWVDELYRQSSWRVVSVPFCNESDRQVLGNLHAGTDGTRWSESAGWLTDLALEQWHGVQADSLGRVTALRLSDNGLSGGLPVGLGSLTRMTALRVDGNALVGRLPSSLTELELEELRYNGTGLCVPVDDGFRTWLTGIGSHVGTGIQCAPWTDRDVLTSLHASTGGSKWRQDRNWLSNAPLRLWHGVTIDDRGRVVGLDLSDNGLVGPIPPTVGSLDSLERLDFQGNDLTGSIPLELGRLANLEVLRLSSNDLTGSMPPELGSLGSLERLYLYWNGLTGPIPSELGMLANLTSLGLGYNRLTGSIPPQLASMTNLRWLDLRNNGLTGPIPPQLASLTNLTSLILHDNGLTGSIPPDLGKLTNLGWLDLYRNRLSGSIPPDLGKLANLRGLRLHQNELTGSIPPSLASLGMLEYLDVAGNDLAGPVPPELGRLSRLRMLGLANNAQLAGILPEDLTNLSLRELQAGGTDLCAPREPAFDAWLGTLSDWWIARCGNVMAYLVQAVQSRTHPVSLVAGEAALLRVFVTAARATGEDIPPVRARFYLNGVEQHVAKVREQPGPIPTEVDEGRLSSSANAKVPGRLVQPGLEMVVEIDPEGTLDPGLGVSKRIPDVGRMAVPVVEMPSLDFTVIPFLWTQDPDRSMVDMAKGMAADPHRHPLLAATRTLLPVGGLDVRAHDPVASTTNDAYELLRQTEAIRVMEGRGGYYMGMMAPMPTLGVIGVAYVSGRSSFSRPDGDVVAHELGHNMSLLHAPCGLLFDSDPSFPYPDGSIGAWGYDFGRSELVPPSRPDLMSYCDPVGISDYHFAKALRHRLNRDAAGGIRIAAAPATSLLLWGGVNPDGQPFLDPAFVVDAPPALPDSTGDYTLTGRSSDGNELFSLSFTMPEVASEEDLGSSFVFAVPVRPEWADVLARITLLGPEGSATLNAASDLPVAIVRDPGSGQVRGFLRDIPDPASVQADAAVGAAPGTRLELLFSRGLPDRAAWQR